MTQKKQIQCQQRSNAPVQAVKGIESEDSLRSHRLSSTSSSLGSLQNDRLKSLTVHHFEVSFWDRSLEFFRKISWNPGRIKKKGSLQVIYI